MSLQRRGGQGQGSPCYSNENISAHRSDSFGGRLISVRARRGKNNDGRASRIRAESPPKILLLPAHHVSGLFSPPGSTARPPKQAAAAGRSVAARRLNAMLFSARSTFRARQLRRFSMRNVVTASLAATL